MKYFNRPIFFLLSLAILVSSGIFITKQTYAQQQAAVITVYPDTILGDVNKLVFGQNLFYQYVEQTGKNPDEIASLLKETGASIVRYPGGLSGDLFHWYNTIGPVNTRPEVCRDYDYGKYTFGLVEFLTVADKAGAQVVYTLNEDTGTPAEARSLLAFTNKPYPQDSEINKSWTVDSWRANPTGMPDLYYAWLRGQPGYGERKTPWNIKYVEIGNEIYAGYCPQNSTTQCNTRGYVCPNPGRLNNTTSDGNANFGVDIYIQRLSLFADALRSVDPSVQIGAVGYNYCPGCPWNTSIVNDPRLIDPQKGPKINFLIDHPYVPGVLQKNTLLTQAEYDQAVISSPYNERIKLLLTWQNTLQGKKLAITEHNADFYVDSGESSYDLRAAVLTAGRLNNYLQNSSVLMANFWHMRMPAMYWPASGQSRLGPTGLVYKLYHDYLQQKIIKGDVAYNSSHSTKPLPPFLSDMQLVPDIDSISSISTDGQTLSVFLLNRNIDRTIPITISLGTFQYAQMEKNTLMTTKQGTDALYANNISEQQVYVDTKISASSGQTISDNLPAHTLVVYSFRKTALPTQSNPSPTVNTVQNCKPTGAAIEGNTTFSWDAYPGASSYYFRLNDTTSANDTWYACQPNTSGDLCRDDYKQTSLLLPLQAGHTYDWWVHARIGDTLTDPCAVKHLTISASCPKKTLGDINCDNAINTLDYQLVVNSLNLKDNKYSIFDLNAIVANFGK